MASLNKVTLIGHLGRDPEMRHLENGATVAKFSIATTESYKDKSDQWQDQTEWHDIIMWRLLAERAEKQLKKGSFAYIEGKLTHRKWVDKEGNNRKSTEIVAQTFKLLDKRESSGNSNYFPSPTDEVATSNNVKLAPAKKEQAASASASAQQDSEVEEPADDLPF